MFLAIHNLSLVSTAIPPYFLPTTIGSVISPLPFVNIPSSVVFERSDSLSKISHDLTFVYGSSAINESAVTVSNAILKSPSEMASIVKEQLSDAVWLFVEPFPNVYDIAAIDSKWLLAGASLHLDLRLVPSELRELHPDIFVSDDRLLTRQVLNP